MQALSSHQMLAAWDRGRAQSHPAALALTLLAAAQPDLSPGALAELSIGERDRRLLAIREQVFGTHLIGLAPCGACGQTLEVEFDLPRVEPPASGPREQSYSLRAGAFELIFRLPNSLDLLSLDDPPESAGGIEEKRGRLLQRVILRASRNGQGVPYSYLPESLLAQLEQALEDADPQADVRLNLSCQACGNRWQVPFDIVSFLWSELEAWAIRLLREVHILARAYSWSETEILNMSQWRRHCYLEMLGE